MKNHNDLKLGAIDEPNTIVGLPHLGLEICIGNKGLADLVKGIT